METIEIFTKKVKKIMSLAEKLDLSIVIGAKSTMGMITTACSTEFLNSESEEMTNIFLMIKNKGDLNKFLLDKSKKMKEEEQYESFLYSNPQVNTTKH